MLRFLTAGESHGKELIVILDGFPAGVELDVHRIAAELKRRQGGYGRSGRQKLEDDAPEFVGGLRHGITTGAPLAVKIKNKDWENWQHAMSVLPPDMSAPEVQEQLRKKAITRFRPGHADLAGTIKYKQADIRNVLERASARETASRTAMGAACEQLLNVLGVQVEAHVLQIGHAKSGAQCAGMSIAQIKEALRASELHCLDPKSEKQMIEDIKKCMQKGDTLGGVIEVLADGLPVGLGSYTQWDARLDGQLAAALMSVQAIKAVEIGEGVHGAQGLGSEVHDAIYPGSRGDLPFHRKTNRSGGIEGGMTNGERLMARAYMKPIPTLREGLPSVSFPDYKAQSAHFERSDVCSVPAASVVCKAMVCFVLLKNLLDKFGGDNLGDIADTLSRYRKACATTTAAVKSGK